MSLNTNAFKQKAMALSKNELKPKVFAQSKK
jgi:hypothetical protein